MGVLDAMASKDKTIASVILYCGLCCFMFHLDGLHTQQGT